MLCSHWLVISQLVMDECVVPKLPSESNEAVYISPSPPSPLHLSLPLSLCLSLPSYPRSILINPGRISLLWGSSFSTLAKLWPPPFCCSLMPCGWVSFHHESVTRIKSVNHLPCQRFQLGLPCPPRLWELGTNSALTVCLLIKHLPPWTQAVSNLKRHCCYVHSYFSVPLRNTYIFSVWGSPHLCPQFSIKGTLSPLHSSPAFPRCLFGFV